MITVNGTLVDQKRFPNGESYVELPKGFFEEYPGCHFQIIWQYESDTDFFTLNLLNNLFKQNTNDDFSVLCKITSMPYERMDRSEQGQHFSLEVAVSLLPKNWHYLVFAYHSEVSINLLKEHTMCSVKGSLVMDKILAAFEEDQTLDKDQHVFVLPDKGAVARYSDLLSEYDLEIYHGEKVRDFETGEILRLKLLDAQGSEVKKIENKSAIVLDDLSSYGGTFSYMADLLEYVGVTERYLLLEKVELSAFKSRMMEKYIMVYSTNLLQTPGIAATNKNFKTVDVLN